MADGPLNPVEYRSTPGETWREFAPGYDVSDLGRIRSRKNARWGLFPRGGFRILKLVPANNPGEPYMSIRVDGQTRLVHVIVLEAFVGPRPTALHQASHIDRMRWNNRIDNLCWETRAENEARKAGHGTLPRGTQNGHAKLTEADVAAIRYALPDARIPYRTIAAVYGVSPGTVSDINRRRSWFWLEDGHTYVPRKRGPK